ncbi:MAG: ABC transporter substrate-binding protein, partial [Dehalococcoidia bacterium]|nr:ABC transporter substrate-binding protein [Dehalococcoidia bacterium]
PAQPSGTPAPGAAGGSKDPIKIGMVFSLSGGFSGPCGAIKRGIDTEIEMFNKQGGVNGRPVEAIVYDDQSKPEEAALLLKKLAQQDNVPVILGPCLAAMIVPNKAAIQDTKTPAMAFGAITFTKDDQYLFTLVQPVEMGLDFYLDYSKKKGWTKVATIDTTDDLGERAHAYLKTKLPQLGMQLVAEERYGIKDTDVTPQLSKIKAANPQVLMNWASGDPAALVYKNARQIGLDVPDWPSSAAGTSTFFKLTGDVPKKNLLMTIGSKLQVADQLADSDPIKKQVQDFVQTFQAKFNSKPEYSEAIGADSARMVLEALKTAGPDRAKINSALENAKMKGLAADYAMTPTNHNAVDPASFIAVTAQGSAWVKAD